MICEVYKSRLVKLFSVFVILKKQKNWTPIVNTHCIKIGVQLWAEWRDLNPRGNRPQAAASPPPAGLDGALRLHEAVGSVCGTKKGVLT